MTDKPTPTDSEIDALWRFKASKNWDSTLAMRTSFTRAALAKCGQPAKARAESVNQNNLENLLELIDNFAETRHTCGHWTYNLKSNEARQKVIAALKGNDLS